MITYAPEYPESRAFEDYCLENGIVPSAGIPTLPANRCCSHGQPTLHTSTTRSGSLSTVSQE